MNEALRKAARSGRLVNYGTQHGAVNIHILPTYVRVTLPPLVTLAEVKPHCRVDHAFDDASITFYLGMAQERIIRELNYAADPSWTAETAPFVVRYCIMLLTAYAYQNRGDRNTMKAVTTGEPEDAEVWQTIWLLLGPYRDPTVV